MRRIHQTEYTEYAKPNALNIPNCFLAADSGYAWLGNVYMSTCLNTTRRYKTSWPYNTSRNKNTRYHVPRVDTIALLDVVTRVDILTPVDVATSIRYQLGSTGNNTSKRDINTCQWTLGPNLFINSEHLEPSMHIYPRALYTRKTNTRASIRPYVYVYIYIYIYIYIQ